MAYTASDFLTSALATVHRAAESQADAIGAAAFLISDALASGKKLWVFGTGHSHMIAEEFYGRAGGLMDVHAILEPGLMLHEGLLKSSLLERRPGLAADLLEVHDPGAGDVAIIASNSGRNAVPVEFAEGCRSRGTGVIAITSLAHARAVGSRAPSGMMLHELADVVIDNCGVPGDAVVDGEMGAVGATSTAVGAMLAQALVVDVVGRMQVLGRPVRTYVSNNA
ncbi:sugar isomerase domain-containing protein [Brachybacterium alimentarium]|uniref:sugar isomerase domain-containing protein n=1 Tax=Brachybacterium alimentarium TaxID=47845 RepID=UPI003FCFC1B6